MRRSSMLTLAALVLASCTNDPVAPDPPTASFVITPTNGSNDTDFQVDASASHDATNSSTTLQVRWDWEDDGTWDTDWTHDKIATHRYTTAGTWTIRLRVRDAASRIGETTRDVTVINNIPPETSLQQSSKHLDTGYRVTFTWTGSDVDGRIDGFLVGWDGVQLFTNAVGATLAAPSTFGDHTFSCAAQDNEGRLDPTPSTLTFTVPHSFLDSPSAIVDALALAYRTLDTDLLLALLANDPDRNAELLFILSEPTEEGETQWGFETEARLHRRMFEPENPDPGDLPVPLDLWLEHVDISLIQQTSFVERMDLYSRDGGADGLLDPTVWRAVAATYSTDIFFSMRGELDYQVNGLADFVIIEDLAKNVGDAGKFLMFIWEDLGSAGAHSSDDDSALSSETWSGLKDLYR